MRIETTRFGPLDLEESSFVHFPWGIPGFEEIKRYVLLEHRQGPFQWLQAVDSPDVAFIVCTPDVFGMKYLVPQDKWEPMGAGNDEDLLVLLMVSLDRGAGSIRPHLRGPLLFNAASRQACQWFIESRDMDKFVLKTEAPEEGGKDNASER